MNYRIAIRLLVAGVAVVIFAGGCLPSRSEYYHDVRQSRVRAYERWQNAEKRNEDRPILKGELSLEEAVLVGLQYNPQLRAAVQEKAKAEGRLFEAYSEALPRLDLTGQYERLDQVMNIDLGVQSFQIGDEDNYSYRVQITQPLYRGGTIPAALRGARLFDYMSDEKVRSAVEQVAYQVASAYMDTTLAERLIEVQKASLDSAKAFQEQVEAKRQEGMAREYDVLRARVDVSNIQADLIEQRNKRDRARTRLCRAMGVSQKSDTELLTGLGFKEVDVSFAEAVSTAFQNRPDIYQAILSVGMQKEALNEAYSAYLPDLDASFWHLWAKPDPQQASNIEWDTDWAGAISLTWPLFDGLAREGRIVQRKAELRKLEILLGDTEEKALLEVRNALLELENAQQLVETQKLNLERADRALELVQDGYKEGVNTELEVLDARAAVTRARGLYYQSLHRHMAARLALQQAMGILGSEPGAREVPGMAEELGLDRVKPDDHKAVSGQDGPAEETKVRGAID